MVISLRSAAGIATIWVVAIGGVSATAWIAIDRAGRDITNASVNSLAPPPLSTPSALEPTVTGQTPDTEPPARSVAAPPPAAPTPSTTLTSPDKRTATPATPQARTVSVPGGHITVLCIRSRIQLQVAQPENEWRVHVEDADSGRISVSFTKGNNDEESGRTEVKAACNQGIPDFEVKAE